MTQRIALGILMWLVCAAPAGAATGWGTYAPLGPAGHSQEAVLTTADELVVAVSTDAGMLVAVQPAGGGAAATQELGPSEWSSTRLVADGQGGAYFTRVDADGALQLLRRPPGGTFTVDRTFAGPASNVALAANPRGDVLVVWATTAGGLAALREAGGAWREPVKLPALTGRPDARLSDSGWSIIAWPGAQDASAIDPLTFVSLSPAGEASVPSELHAGHEGGPVAMAIDDAGRFAIGWAESAGPGYSYEGPLELAHGQAGAITARHAFGSGTGLSIAANRHGDALLTWRLPSEMYFVHGVQMNRMATLDLRDGSIGADEPAPVESYVSTMTDAGDRMLVGGTNGHWSSRARRGGLLRASVSFGCDLNPSRPFFAAIDSKGRAVVVAQPVPSPWTTGVIGPHVIRDHPEEFWNPFSCAGITRPSPIPSRIKAVAGRGVEIPLTSAVDPEASRERFEWDLDDDGTFETDTGAWPTGRHTWPSEGLYALRVRQVRWFGESSETRSWRIEVEVAPAPVQAAVPERAATPKPRLVIGRRSLRRALREGLDFTVQIPAGGRTRFELRRRLGGPRTSVLGRKTRDISPGAQTKVRIRLPRQVRRLKTLRVELRAIQGRTGVAAARATLR